MQVDARIVEPDQSVGARHAQIEGLGEISVHDPFGCLGERAHAFARVRSIAIVPARQPVMEIEIVNRDAELRGEPRSTSVVLPAPGEPITRTRRMALAQARCAARAAFSRAKSSPA